MSLERDRLLASPLFKVIELLENKDIDFQLTQLKPPNRKEQAADQFTEKRVLNIRERENFLEIIWSFQYND